MGKLKMYANYTVEEVVDLPNVDASSCKDAVEYINKLVKIAKKKIEDKYNIQLTQDPEGDILLWNDDETSYKCLAIGMCFTDGTYPSDEFEEEFIKKKE